MDVTWDEWYAAVTMLVGAKLREAESFLLFKARKETTDGTAARMAYVETKGEVDIAQARVDYLRAQLGEK